MGKVRVCGARCHNAKRPTCRCWCGGLFHGANGEDARQAFRDAFTEDKVPTTERAFMEITGQPDLFQGGPMADRWRDALTEARKAAL